MGSGVLPFIFERNFENLQRQRRGPVHGDPSMRPQLLMGSSSAMRSFIDLEGPAGGEPQRRRSVEVNDPTNWSVSPASPRKLDG